MYALGSSKYGKVIMAVDGFILSTYATFNQNRQVAQLTLGSPTQFLDSLR